MDNKKLHSYKKSQGFTPTPFVRLPRLCRGAHSTIPRKVSGFTLVETLVGITLLITSITAVLSVTSLNISASGSAREQITAFFLAKEAIEIARNTRDNNALTGASWLSGLSSCISGMCKIDATQITNPASSCSGTCPFMKLNSDGIYQYDSGDDTIFIREVEITETVSNVEAIIAVTIRWKRKTLERSFTIEEHIFNWK